MRFCYHTLFAFIILYCAACTSHRSGEKIPLVSYGAPALFGASPDFAVESELFFLTEEQKNHFLNYFNTQHDKDTEPYLRLFEYLDGGTFNFSYRATTNVASDTFSSEQGNCMSLAILTTALARVADVKVAYELIDSTPVFEKKGDVIIKGVHVRTKLYRSNVNPMHLSLTRPGLIVDYFPGGDKRFLGNITDEEFVAMYYRNRAAEYLELNDYGKAYWYMRSAVEYAPEDVSNINTMAVIFRKVGALAKAEEIYRYGISISDDKLSLLKNYRILLLSQERYSEADEIAKVIATIDDPSPYNWIKVADYAYQEKNYQEAERYYRRAIDLAPYLQYGYLGLAKTFYAQLLYDEAKEMILRAMENNSNAHNHQMYEAKLKQLMNAKALNLQIYDE